MIDPAEGPGIEDDEGQERRHLPAIEKLRAGTIEAEEGFVRGEVTGDVRGESKKPVCALEAPAQDKVQRCIDKSGQSGCQHVGPGIIYIYAEGLPGGEAPQGSGER